MILLFPFLGLLEEKETADGLLQEEEARADDLLEYCEGYCLTSPGCYFHY